MEKTKIVWIEKKEYKTLINFNMAASFLGCERNLLTGDMAEDYREAADLLIANICPRYMFQMIQLSRGQKDELFGSFPLEKFFSKEKILLTGNSIREHLGKEEIAVAGCLTLGEGADLVIAQLEQESMLKAIFADALANAAVELLRAELERDAARTFNREFGWLFGIGYGDLPLSLQKDFLEAMGAQEIGLTATKKMILCPSKSVTGFLNVRKKDGAGCNGKCSICPERERCHVFKSED
jgi:5-methyltetrahydrofolate--homocysteine methyltransferase